MTAIAQLTRAVEIEPAQPLFHLVLGQLLAEQQRLAPAIEHLRRALALAPRAVTVDPAEYPYNLGLALRLNGDLDEAEAQFRAALARNPDHALARRSLGLVLRHKEDAAAAVVELRRAVALLPDDAQGHHLLATVLLKLGDLPGATTELREATRLDPALIEARVTLAQTLARSGHKDEALKEQAEVRRLNAEKADFGRMLVLLDSSAERCSTRATSPARSRSGARRSRSARVSPKPTISSARALAPRSPKATSGRTPRPRFARRSPSILDTRARTPNSRACSIFAATRPAPNRPASARPRWRPALEARLPVCHRRRDQRDAIGLMRSA